METYPTRNGIAIPVWDLALPPARGRERNNHHLEFTAKALGRTAVTQALRDLERLQVVLPVNQHNWIHDTYGPPEFPTEEQAALEVIRAYDQGEQFKIYNRQCHWYDRQDIPPELIDGFIATYGLRRVFSMAAD